MLIEGCNSTEENESFKNHSKKQGIIDIKYAKGFSVFHEDGRKFLCIINDTNTKERNFCYIIDNSDTISNDSKFPVIKVPVRKIVSLSSTHVGCLSALNADSLVVGISKKNFIYNKRVRDNISIKKTLEIGESISDNIEGILQITPDVIIDSYFPDRVNSRQALLAKHAIHVLFSSDWRESTPLGRAEWLKFFSVLVDQEEKANRIFDSLDYRYNALVTLVSSIEDRVSIITEIPYRGVWYVPGGNSYMANLLKDANADYNWEHNSSEGSISLSFEEAYSIGLEAKKWILSGNYLSKTELLDIDVRLSNLQSFKTGEIYVANKRRLQDGANDYFESGIVNPDKHLKDIIKILYPHLLPEWELYYYTNIK